MRLEVELVNRYRTPRSVNGLLYTPTDSAATVRETRRYILEARADAPALEAFARKVLQDPVSEDLHVGPSPALDGWDFLVDIRLKPGLLDLEKEYVLKAARDLREAGVALESVTPVRRIYVSGAGASLPPERLTRDVVNPAIQHGEVVSA